MTKRLLGFDRLIEREWLDVAGAVAGRGTDVRTAQREVWDSLSSIPGTDAHSSRGKTRTVILRMWITPSSQTRELRDRAALLLPRCTADERLALHWALAVAAYPFFADVVGAVGRALALEGQASEVWVNKRIVEAWGDRSTISRAINRAIRSVAQWGLLRLTPERTYVAARPPVAVCGDICEALIEAILLAGEARAIPLSQLLTHPVAFPWQLRQGSASVVRSKRFEIHREGLDTEMVQLRSTPA